MPVPLPPEVRARIHGLVSYSGVAVRLKDLRGNVVLEQGTSRMDLTGEGIAEPLRQALEELVAAAIAGELQ